MYTNISKQELLKLIEEKDLAIETLNDRNFLLQTELDKLKIELNELKSQASLIAKAIISAEKYKEKEEDKVRAQYELELNNLKLFTAKYQKYFAFLREKYPYYPATKNAEDLVICFDKIFKKHIDDKSKIKVMNLLLDSESLHFKEFDPTEKLSSYIQNDTEINFDLDQIINPGELNLEELCKELGLAEDEK